MIHVASLLASAWSTPAPRARPSMCAGVAEGLRVELAGFFPVVPAIDPQAKMSRALVLDGGAPSGLCWLPDSACLTLLSGGSPWGWTAEEGLRPLPLPSVSAPVISIAPFGAGGIALCTAREVVALDLETSAVAPLSTGVAGAPKLVYSLSDRRLLMVVEAAGGNSLVLLEPDEGRSTELVSGLGEVRGACVSSDESAVLLSMGQGVSRLELDLKEGKSGRLEALFSTAPAVPSHLSIDTQGNVYVGLGAEVGVFDDSGERLLSVEAPSEVRSCCFGDVSLTTLFLCVDDAVWSVSASVQGIGPPSELLRSKIERQVGAGERRHDGW